MTEGTKKFLAIRDEKDNEVIHVYGFVHGNAWHLTALHVDSFEFLFGDTILDCVKVHDVYIDIDAEPADQEVKDAIERGEYY